MKTWKFWWKVKTLWNLQTIRKKRYGRETETDIEKRKKIHWIKEVVQYLLDSLKRYKVIYDFSEKDFDADKTVQYSKLRKEMVKKHEGFGPDETPANPRAELSIQERKEFEGKIKLENKLINTGYNIYCRELYSSSKSRDSLTRAI